MAIFAPDRRGGAVAVRWAQPQECDIQPDSILDKE
jgi:hypothetical protein